MSNNKNKEDSLLKTILKVLFGLSLAFLSSHAMAENYRIPTDADGRIPGDTNMVGADVIDSTGTAGNYGITEPVVLYGVCTSSIATTAYATFRDSATLNSTSDVKMVFYPNGITVAGNVQTLCTTLPAPVIFRNGMSVTLSAAAGGGPNTRWMFIYRRRLTGNVSGRDVAPTATSASD